MTELPHLLRLGLMLVGATAVVLSGRGAAFAQQSVTQPATSKDTTLPGGIRVDQGGGILFTRHLGVVFGGIKQGSSIAVGPAASWTFDKGDYIQLKAGWSVRNFKLVQARFDSRPLFGGRSLISTRLRWQDAPELPLYQRGPEALNRHLTFGATKTEWSAFLRTTVAPKTTISVGSGVEGYSSKGRWDDAAEALDVLGAIPPGLSTRPWFVRSFASASNDTRFSPDYTRTGHLLEAGVYHYHDQQDGTQSFQQYELAVVQLLPTFRAEGDTPPPPRQYKGALAMFGRAWLSHTAPGREVPFYLMPSLGGGDYLRGYGSYRFHDRHALLFGTEYRYAIHNMIDAAVLLEAGTVSPDVTTFSVGRMAPSIAGGIRAHSKKSGLLRLDLARGRDGVKFSIGVSVGS